MTSLISKEAIDKSGFSLPNLEAWGIAAAASVGGMVVSHVALKLIKKQDSLLVTGGVALAGIGGAMFFKPTWAKFLCLGVAGYGLLRAANVAVAEATAPGDSGAAGLSGLLSEGLKAKIRNYLPNLGSIGDTIIEGIGDTLLGDDDLHGMPNLDDMAGVEDIGYVDVSETAGVGSML